MSMNIIISQRFLLKSRIGGGSFGEIYAGEDILTHSPVAIKLEPQRSRSPQLEFESHIYQILQFGDCIPKLHWFGRESNYNIMIIDLLGKSLEDLFQGCHGRLSLKTVLMVATQMISCIQFMHQNHLLHRDIKPDNFVMGLGQQSAKVYIIDFGLSKRFEDPRTLTHIPTAEGKTLTGTARYASLSAMRGFEQSRRDDMESLGFVWLYLLRGNLPWMGIPAKDQATKFKKIADVKAKTSFESLCEGFPEEFIEYFKSVRELKFTEEPKYEEYRTMFKNLYERLGYADDGIFDWSSHTSLPVCNVNGHSTVIINPNQANNNYKKQKPMMAMPLPPKALAAPFTSPTTANISPRGNPPNVPPIKPRVINPTPKPLESNGRKGFGRHYSNLIVSASPSRPAETRKEINHPRVKLFHPTSIPKFDFK